MFDLAPDLPDDTSIEMVRFSPLIRKSFNAAGLKTIGEIRAMSDDKLRSIRGVGTGSLAYLRKTIGTGAEGEGEVMLMVWAIAIIVLGVAVLIIKRNVRKNDVLHGTFIEDVNE